MRKTFLVSILAFLLSGCIREGMVPCEYINLTFHVDNSTEKFDQTIGNDVRVYLYKDDDLCQTFHVPFGDIHGGKTVRIPKPFAGPFRIAAWAVPHDGNERMIPLSDEHPRFSSAVVEHKNTSRHNLAHYTPLDNLFLGVVEETSGNTLPEANYIVPMKNMVCNVNVYVDPGLLENPSANGNPNLHVEGTSRAEDLAMQPYGEEVCVSTMLDQQTHDGMIAASSVGLWPSYNHKYISVTVWCGNAPFLAVETDELSEPGKEITIVIRGRTAEIRVNGWKVKTTSVIFNKQIA